MVSKFTGSLASVGIGGALISCSPAYAQVSTELGSPVWDILADVRLVKKTSRHV
jgi:hypothetical protein